LIPTRAGQLAEFVDRADAVAGVDLGLLPDGFGVLRSRVFAGEEEAAGGVVERDELLIELFVAALQARVDRVLMCCMSAAWRRSVRSGCSSTLRKWSALRYFTGKRRLLEGVYLAPGERLGQGLRLGVAGAGGDVERGRVGSADGGVD
jgi:hypothetical protein